MKKNSPPLRVVACVIEKDGKFLITQRLKQSHLGHLWEFPGGKIEAGETLEECAVRECLEETGVLVRPVRLLEEILHHYPEKSVHLYFMLCELLQGEPKALHCADWTWAGPEDFPHYEFPAADTGIIQNYIQKI